MTSKLKSKLIAQLRIAPIHYLTIVVLVATLFIPKQVYNYEEMKALHLGYPVGFYVQDFSRYTPLFFPQEFNFGSPWEDPAVINIPYFILSYFIVYLLLLLLFRMLKIVMKYLLGKKDIQV